MKKILHITNQPTPYRLPQYRAFTKELSKIGFDFKVIFVGGRGRKREWKFSDKDFEGLSYITSDKTEGMNYYDIKKHINLESPDIITLAWAMDFLALKILFLSKLKKIPVILYTGATQNALSIVKQPKKFLTILLRKFFFKLCNGFIAYGTTARNYLVSQGINKKNISIAINTVDTKFFREEVQKLRSSGLSEQHKQTYKNKFGDNFLLHILFIGELIPLKQIHYSINAIGKLKRNDIALHIVGDGIEKENLRLIATQNNISDCVFFHGYKQKSEIPKYLAIADCALFTSDKEERFGLVLVEYCSAALPVISTIYAGGTADVIVDSVTGFAIKPEDISGFSERISLLATDKVLRAKLSEAAYNHALHELSLEKSALGYSQAIQKLNF